MWSFLYKITNTISTHWIYDLSNSYATSFCFYTLLKTSSSLKWWSHEKNQKSDARLTTKKSIKTITVYLGYEICKSLQTVCEDLMSLEGYLVEYNGEIAKKSIQRGLPPSICKLLSRQHWKDWLLSLACMWHHHHILFLMCLVSQTEYPTAKKRVTIPRWN